MDKEKIAVYPGSFDPMHHGHIYVLEQVIPLFSCIYIIVTNNINKTPRLDWEERVHKVQALTLKYPNVKLIENKTPVLTVDIAKKYNASYLLRGLRDDRDLHYELNLNRMNHELNHEITTIFVVSNLKHQPLSSSLLAEVKQLNRKK